MATIRLILVLALLVTTVPAFAETSSGAAEEATLDVLLDTIRANRKALVAVNLNLSDAEAGAFWPIFDRYDAEMKALGDRMVALLEDYAASFKNLSDEKAMKLVDDYLTIEAERAKVRRTYVDEMAKVVPGRTVARFFQIENKMDAVIRYDLAAEIPVVEEAIGVPTK